MEGLLLQGGGRALAGFAAELSHGTLPGQAVAPHRVTHPRQPQKDLSIDVTARFRA